MRRRCGCRGEFYERKEEVEWKMEEGVKMRTRQRRDVCV
jgi:hypothetical protein